jgi:hypothetical protein
LDKVLESGEGHTLSGKPLDPLSAAAVQYLNKGMLIHFNAKEIESL